jgi:hypothetical protein
MVLVCWKIFKAVTTFTVLAHSIDGYLHFRDYSKLDLLKGFFM